MIKIAACVKDGVIVNVASYDEDTSQSWLEAVKPDFDEIIIADDAGIGWTLEKDGLRPPTPYASWTWNSSEWVAPVPYPTNGGRYEWNEEVEDWVAIDEEV